MNGNHYLLPVKQYVCVDREVWSLQGLRIGAGGLELKESRRVMQQMGANVAAAFACKFYFVSHAWSKVPTLPRAPISCLHTLQRLLSWNRAIQIQIPFKVHAQRTYQVKCCTLCKLWLAVITKTHVTLTNPDARVLLKLPGCVFCRF